MYGAAGWWARNQIVIESGLIGRRNITLIKYEALASHPMPMLKWLFDQIGIQYRDRVGRNITARSIGRHSAPNMNTDVQKLCDTTLATLDNAFHAANPP